MTPFRLSNAYSAEQDADYAKALTSCDSLAMLRDLVTAYKPLALDAFAVVEKMTEADWPMFVKGLKSERRGKFAGDEWAHRFGAILMPLPMLTITQVAQQFHAPFGVAWIRCKEHRPDLLVLPSSAPDQETRK